MTTHRPLMIIVQGKPGAGKTTLSKRLAKDLGIHRMGKDDLKEFLFDEMGIGDRAWSTTLGRASSEMLYPLAEALLDSGVPFILESAYYRALSEPRLQAMVESSNARCIQIYCEIEPGERRRRFIARNESGERHPGHVDAMNYDASDEKADNEKYAPLDVGELWKVDTTSFGEPEYDILRRRVAALLDEYIDHER